MPRRRSATRHKLGIRWPRLQDWRCRRRGHVAALNVSSGMLGGAWWPICARCGYAFEPAREDGAS